VSARGVKCENSCSCKVLDTLLRRALRIRRIGLGQGMGRQPWSGAGSHGGARVSVGEKVGRRRLASPCSRGRGVREASGGGTGRKKDWGPSLEAIIFLVEVSAGASSLRAFLLGEHSLVDWEGIQLLKKTPSQVWRLSGPGALMNIRSRQHSQ